MSKLNADQLLGADHAAARANALDKALEEVTIDLERAGESMHAFLQGALSRLSIPLNRDANGRSRTPHI